MTLTAESHESERFRSLIARHLGLRFDANRSAFLVEQLQARSKAHGESHGSYLARLEKGALGDELRALAPLLTVSETYFFRNQNQFRALQEIVFPELLQRPYTASKLRILSAGCASGEEAYSIAIAAREASGRAAGTIAIQAVDLNPAVLAKAARGRYNAWALRDTTLEIRQKWFQASGNGTWLLDPSIRQAVEFEEGNLLDASALVWRSGPYHTIFCRNVLMYFTPQGVREVIRRLHKVLMPGGYLFLGHAESLRGISEDFRLCHTHDTFYYCNDAVLRNDRACAPAADGWPDVIHCAAKRIHLLAPAPTSSARSAASRRDAVTLALDLLQGERYAEALQLIQSLPAVAACDDDSRLLHAVLLTHLLQLDAAESLCQQLLADDEFNAGAHYLMALCRERAGDVRAAREHDRRAIYIDPTFAMPRLHLGLLARRDRETESARRELARAHILLQREETSRLLMFGGGFTRDTLISLCRAELQSCGGTA